MSEHPEHLPSVTGLPPHYDNVVAILQLFFPQFFDPTKPGYVEPDTMTQLIALAEGARPWCLPEDRQDFAQAMYTAYLVDVRNDFSSGESSVPVAGPITMEKEGDIQVQYAMNASGISSQMSSRPATDPWDAWNKLYSRCARGSILTRYGDPVKSASDLTTILYMQAYNVWRQTW